MFLISSEAQSRLSCWTFMPYIACKLYRWIWNGSRSESPTSKDEQRYDLAGGGETKFDVTRDVTCFKMLWWGGFCRPHSTQEMQRVASARRCRALLIPAHVMCPPMRRCRWRGYSYVAVGDKGWWRVVCRGYYLVIPWVTRSKDPAL